ncbi:hypothetical protein GMJAKD_11430 [Candidatus Electrothrix aarhusensis]
MGEDEEECSYWDHKENTTKFGFYRCQDGMKNVGATDVEVEGFFLKWNVGYFLSK